MEKVVKVIKTLLWVGFIIPIEVLIIVLTCGLVTTAITNVIGLVLAGYLSLLMFMGFTGILIIILYELWTGKDFIEL